MKITFDYHELRRKLSMYLTPFMIPEFFVKMSSLPITANGKVDRKALPVVLKGMENIRIWKKSSSPVPGWKR
jgi:non-ribosomal peptide synthetase component E (peptide arylation enzyme)